MKKHSRIGLGLAALGAFSALCWSESSARAAIPVVDSCAEADYLDRTGSDADRLLGWDFSFPGSGERCIKIRAGQSVHWSGSLADHPLSADQGEVPNPIASHGPDGLVSFPTPGVFGFRCDYHFEMRGAIQVVAAPPTVPRGGSASTGLLALLLGLLSLTALVRRRTLEPRC